MFLHKIFYSELGLRRFRESSLEFLFPLLKDTFHAIWEDEELSCENWSEGKKILCGSKVGTIDHCLDKEASWLWAEREKSDDL